MHQQLWGYKVEEKLYLGVREQKRLNTTELYHVRFDILTIVNVKTMIFCDMTLWSLIDTYISHARAVPM
jgi:hypothetical protein